MTTQEIHLLRDLASRVAEIAAHPDMDRRRQDWYRQNSLQPGKPLVFASPEGSWGELIPLETYQVQDESLRGWEAFLRTRIYVWEHFADDQVIDTRLSVPHVSTDSGWGLQVNYHTSDSAPRGSYIWDPPLKDPADLAKLHFPEVEIDWPATERRLAQLHEIFDGILDVELRGWAHGGAGMIQDLSRLRGLQQIMLDMIERPEWLHEAMTFLRDGLAHRLDSLEEQGLLSLNNGNDYNCSGAWGFTHDLPAPDFAGRVRPQDQWGFADAQEVSEISPRMFWEFVLSYQITILERFGLNTYGCCEPLHDRFEYVLRIPRLRRVSVSPWCDREISAEALRGRCVFSWKPNPARLAAIHFDEDLARREIRETLRMAEGCVVEMVMKDTHTVNHDPSRFDRWTRIAQKEAEAAVS